MEVEVEEGGVAWVLLVPIEDGDVFSVSLVPVRGIVVGRQHLRRA